MAQPDISSTPRGSSPLVEHHKSLKALNTFGIDISAKYYVEIRSEEALRGVLSEKQYLHEKKLVLGGGSNILFTKDFDGLVLKNLLRGIQVIEETEDHVLIKAAAGEIWQDLVLWCIERNYAGLENLCSIPGSVGASPVQNIGAYGVELKDTFYELEALALTPGQSPLRLNNKDCKFGYRNSIFKEEFKGRYFITWVTFKLTKLTEKNASSYTFKTNYGAIRDTLEHMQVPSLTLPVMSGVISRIRRAKLPDPQELGNAGSFFKNPTVSQEALASLIKKYPALPFFGQENNQFKIPAGWLIEQCGWKGKKMGPVGCYQAQALVLVNYGGAEGSDVQKLAFAIQRSVKNEFGIDLTPEVNIL